MGFYDDKFLSYSLTLAPPKRRLGNNAWENLNEKKEKAILDYYKVMSYVIN